MKKNKSNNRLIKKAFKSGDERAFKLLFNLYYDKLTNYVNSFTNDPDITKDLVQDSFIKLWNARDNFDLKQSIPGYLFKTAYFTFIDNYRKEKRKSLMLDDLAYKKRLDLVSEDSDIKEKRIESIKNAIEELPPRCKEIFNMSKFQGYKYSEIADLLNISIKTVESQMGKAFSIIRKKIGVKNILNLFFSIFYKKENSPITAFK